jgi:fatty acid amide hydrolase 2
MNPLLKLGALELARNIRKGNVTSLEVVDAHIARIEAVNPALNAVVADRFDAARDDAMDAGEALQRGEELGPLHGVPCTIKETYGLSGMPNTAGSVLRKGTISLEDAIAVERIRAAGAIPLGVTNVPEMAMWWECYNNVYGRTKNPYDLGRTPGGSSGGEGAIIGAGGSPFGLGSDIGGSIRMPAFFCGIYGHKPTGGLVPMVGHYPRADGLERFSVGGPMCRRATDLMPILEIIAGTDPRDPHVDNLPLGDPKEVKWKDRRVYVLPSLGAQFTVGPSHDQEVALKRTALAFEGQGAIVEEWSSQHLRDAVAIWGAMLAENSTGPGFAATLGGGEAPSFGVELVKCALGFSDFTLPALLFAASEHFTKERDNDHLLLACAALKRELHDVLGNDSVLIAPTHPRAAPKHNRPLLRPMDFVYTGIFNVLEVPATACPMGLGAERLPLGVQVVGPCGGDHLTIAAAMMLEKHTGGWSPPLDSPAP